MRTVLVLAAALPLNGLRLAKPPFRTALTARGTTGRSPPPFACAATEDGIERLEVAADPPDAAGLPSFGSLGASEGVMRNLDAQNITVPNALQRASYEPIAAGRDVVLHAWTGSGKTLAFLLPLLSLLDPSSSEPQALVICPSRELAFQTLRVAKALLADTPLRAGGVAGGANPTRQLETLRKEKPQLLVGTPGRAAELAFEWRKLKLQRIRHLVIDEVDEALRSPHLEPSVRLIDSFRDGRPLQLVLASATADTPSVRRTVAQLLTRPLMLKLARSEGSAADAADGAGVSLPPTITHGVQSVPSRKALEAVRDLVNIEPPPRCIVFVNSPHRAQIVASQLESAYGVRAAELHGRQQREERVAAMRSLLDGRVRIAIATEMGARGLDLPGLTHVVNLEMPTDADHYAHRAGRCGRNGAAGTVLSIVQPEQEFVVSKLTKALGVELHPMATRAAKLQLRPRGGSGASREPRAGKKGGGGRGGGRGGGGGRGAGRSRGGPARAASSRGREGAPGEARSSRRAGKRT